MTLNTQTHSDEQISPAYSSPKQTWTWKGWEKRHWLFVFATALLVLWYLIPKLNASPRLQNAVTHLSTLGGLLFAADSIIKFAQ